MDSPRVILVGYRSNVKAIFPCAPFLQGKGNKALVHCPCLQWVGLGEKKKKMLFEELLKSCRFTITALQAPAHPNARQNAMEFFPRTFRT